MSRIAVGTAMAAGGVLAAMIFAECIPLLFLFSLIAGVGSIMINKEDPS